jgi:TPR repeat protein
MFAHFSYALPLPFPPPRIYRRRRLWLNAHLSLFAGRKVHANAQCNLGVCLYYGQGVAKDEAAAAAWLTQSANQGHAKAQCNLGVCYKKVRRRRRRWW